MSDQIKTIILPARSTGDPLGPTYQRVHLPLNSDWLNQMVFEGEKCKTYSHFTGMVELPASWYEHGIEDMYTAWIKDPQRVLREATRDLNQRHSLGYGSLAIIDESGVYLEAVFKGTSGSTVVTTTSDRVSFDVLKALVLRPEPVFILSCDGISAVWEHGIKILKADRLHREAGPRNRGKARPSPIER